MFLHRTLVVHPTHRGIRRNNSTGTPVAFNVAMKTGVKSQSRPTESTPTLTYKGCGPQLSVAYLLVSRKSASNPTHRHRGMNSSPTSAMAVTAWTSCSRGWVRCHSRKKSVYETAVFFVAQPKERHHVALPQKLKSMKRAVPD